MIDSNDQQVPSRRARRNRCRSLMITRLTQPPPSIDVGAGRRVSHRLAIRASAVATARHRHVRACLRKTIAVRSANRTATTATGGSSAARRVGRTWTRARRPENDAAAHRSIPGTAAGGRRRRQHAVAGDGCATAAGASSSVLPRAERAAAFCLRQRQHDAAALRSALLAPEVLGVVATNRRRRRAICQRGGFAAALVSPRLFWVVLVVAVAVLLGLIVRCRSASSRFKRVLKADTTLRVSFRLAGAHSSRLSTSPDPPAARRPTPRSPERHRAPVRHWSFARPQNDADSELFERRPSIAAACRRSSLVASATRADSLRCIDSTRRNQLPRDLMRRPERHVVADGVSASSVSVVHPSPGTASDVLRRFRGRHRGRHKLPARAASRNIDNTSGCRSSSVSTMSPKGVLWTAENRLPAKRLAGNGTRMPMATGLRFCA